MSDTEKRKSPLPEINPDDLLYMERGGTLAEGILIFLGFVLLGLGIGAAVLLALT